MLGLLSVVDGADPLACSILNSSDMDAARDGVDNAESGEWERCSAMGGHGCAGAPGWGGTPAGARGRPQVWKVNWGGATEMVVGEAAGFCSAFIGTGGVEMACAVCGIVSITASSSASSSMPNMRPPLTNVLRAGDGRPTAAPLLPLLVAGRAADEIPAVAAAAADAGNAAGERPVGGGVRSSGTGSRWWGAASYAVSSKKGTSVPSMSPSSSPSVVLRASVGAGVSSTAACMLVNLSWSRQSTLDWRA